MHPLTLSAADPTLDALETNLRAWVRAASPLAIAFSGGVDSSLLCAVAAAELGPRALAITVDSPLLPRSELAEARDMASRWGLRHEILVDNHIDPIVASNPKNRCYHCKRVEFGDIGAKARELGFTTLADGENLDDAGDFRPGSRAARELGVRSPLREVGFTKQAIRDLSRRLGLSTWDKPAFACLASRIPYGEAFDAPKLGRIEKAEVYLRGLGFRQVRVRSHQDLARIEVEPADRPRLFDTDLMTRIAVTLKGYGFLYVSLDLEGYTMGSLNRSPAPFLPVPGAIPQGD